MDEPLFDRTIKYTIRNKIYILILIFFEFIPILVECYNSSNKVSNLTFEISGNTNFIMKYLTYSNPYGLLKKLISCQNINGSNVCSFPDQTYLIIFGIHIFLFAFVIFILVKLKKTKDDMNFNHNNSKFFTGVIWVFINYMEFFIHVLGMFVFFMVFNYIQLNFLTIFTSTDSGEVSKSIVIILITLIFFTIYLIVYLRKISSYYIMIQFDSQISFPHDSLFSKKYNIFLFYLKILIALENTVSLGFANLTDKIIFLNVCIVGFNYFFIIFILITVIKKEPLFLINYVKNSFKIFLLFLNTFLITFELLFAQNISQNNLFFTIGFVCCLFMASSFTNFLKKNNNRCIYNISPESFILQAINIFYIKNTHRTEDFSNELSMIFYKHKYTCKGKEDKTEYSLLKKTPCIICKQDKYSYLNFLISYKQVIKNYYKNNLNAKVFFNITNEKYIYNLSNDFYELIHLIFIEQLEKRKLIKIAFKTKKMLNKYFNKNQNNDSNSIFYFNLLLFFKHTNNNNNNFVYKFQIIKLYEENKQLFLNSLTDIKYFLESYNAQICQEIYSIVKNVNKSRRKIYANLVNLLKNKEIYTETYSLIASKYIYENMFNCKLEDNIFSSLMINDDEELDNIMSFHYHKDKQIKINYQFDSNCMTIFKTSRGLKQFRNKKFDELFHPQFKHEGMKKFIQLMKENMNEKMDDERNQIKEKENRILYEYFVRHDTKDEFVRMLSMECSISPSTNLNEFMIYGEFHILNNDILIFEKIQGGEKKESSQILVSFSEKISRYLYLTPEIINSLYRFYGVRLTFNKIFKKLNSNTQENAILKQQSLKLSKQNNHMLDADSICLYEIDYSKYYKFYSQISDKISNLQEISQNLIELKNRSTSRSVKKFSIARNLKISQTYAVYCILDSEKFDTNDVDIPGHNNSDVYMNSQNEIETFVYNQSSTASSTSSVYNKRSFGFANQKKSTDYKSGKNSSLRVLTKTSVILCLIIIIYCLADMIIGFVNIKYHENLITILLQFSSLQRTFFHSSRSLFNHFKLDDKYSINFAINGYDYLNFNEVDIKLDNLQKIVIDLQDVVQNSIYKSQLDLVFQENVEYDRITNRGGMISYDKTLISFFDAIKIFINNAKIIVTANRESSTIYRFTYSNKLEDFSNLENKILTHDIMLAEEYLINYPNFVKTFKIVEKNVKLIINDELDNIFNQDMNFLYILLGIHLFLLLFYFLIFRFFKSILLIVIESINNLMNYKFAKFLLTKISCLSSLNEFYEEDPKVIIKKMAQVKKEHKLHEVDVKKQITPQKLIFSKKEDQMEEKNLKSLYQIYFINASSLLDPLYRVIFTLFSCYYTYALIIYIFLLSTRKSFENTVEFYNTINLQINNIFDNANMMQVIILTNKTDYDLNLDVYDNNLMEGYIWSQNNLVLEYSHDSLKLKFNSIFQTYLDPSVLTCDAIYSKYNDEIFNSLDSKYLGKNLLPTLTTICKTFSVMENCKLDMLFEEISYVLRKLISKYNELIIKNNYTDIPDVYSNADLKSISFILLYIMRPISNYIDNEVIQPCLDSNKNSFLIVILVFLTMNIVIEIIISLIIYFKIIVKVQNTIEDLNNFIDIVKMTNNSNQL